MVGKRILELYFANVFQNKFWCKISYINSKCIVQWVAASMLDGSLLLEENLDVVDTMHP